MDPAEKFRDDQGNSVLTGIDNKTLLVSAIRIPEEGGVSTGNTVASLQIPVEQSLSLIWQIANIVNYSGVLSTAEHQALQDVQDAVERYTGPSQLHNYSQPDEPSRPANH